MREEAIVCGYYRPGVLKEGGEDLLWEGEATGSSYETAAVEVDVGFVRWGWGMGEE